MKKIRMQILTILLLISLMLSARGQIPPATLSDSESVTTDISQVSESLFTPADITQYDGRPYVVVNNNVPYFSEEDLTEQSYEFYSDLDKLGRCGVAYANIGIDIMPKEERGEIGQIRPSGWHTVKYNGLIDDNYLYNRCHLIGYQLSGENSNIQNLITGTRYLNVEGMLPFENMVANYITETENHVLYRVTPVFEEDNLVASGVLMEAESVEDKGEGVLFCVYAYNVQPGIIIDYATGESCLDESIQATEPIVSKETEPQGTTYILNMNTKKFHYPSCSSAYQIKEYNRQEYTGSRDDVISQGYIPCKICKP